MLVALGRLRFFLMITLFLFVIFEMEGQNVGQMEEMKQKSNEFTKLVMSEGASLHDKITFDIVPMSKHDFILDTQDSLALDRIHKKFIDYYDYLLDYQHKNGLSIDQLSSIYIDSSNDAPGEMSCFTEWYKRDVHTLSLTLACYASDIASVRESCIARSIQQTIINNASVAECIKSQSQNK